jgi:hypothetical protein
MFRERFGEAKKCNIMHKKHHPQRTSYSPPRRLGKSLNPSKEESSLKVNPAKDEVGWNNLRHPPRPPQNVKKLTQTQAEALHCQTESNLKGHPATRLQQFEDLTQRGNSTPIAHALGWLIEQSDHAAHCLAFAASMPTCVMLLIIEQSRLPCQLRSCCSSIERSDHAAHHQAVSASMLTHVAPLIVEQLWLPRRLRS